MLEASIFIPVAVDIDLQELAYRWEELYGIPLVIGKWGNTILLCTSKEKALATLVERQWYLGEKPVVWLDGHNAIFWDTVSQAIADLRAGGSSGKPFRPAPFLIVDTLFDVASYCDLDWEKADESDWLRQNANAIWRLAIEAVELLPLMEEAAEFLASRSGFDLSTLREEDDEDNDYDE